MSLHQGLVEFQPQKFKLRKIIQFKLDLNSIHTGLNNSRATVPHIL